MSGYQVLDKNGKVIYSSGRGSVCDEICRHCIFHATVTGGMIVCDYLLVMGRRRGCEAGKNCTQRINGKKAPSLDSRLYRLPPNPEREGGNGLQRLCAPRNDGGTGETSPPPAGGPHPISGEAEKAAERKRRKAERRKIWYAKNRERMMEYQRQYRARKRGEQP